MTTMNNEDPADTSADVVGLLRRYGLLGSPLRGAEAEHG